MTKKLEPIGLTIQKITEKLMKSKYTPGPWKVDKVFSLIMGPRGEEIAAIHSGTTENQPNIETCNYNARLIAAAPEMLELLKILEREVDNFDSAEHIKALIAKAEGSHD